MLLLFSNIIARESLCLCLLSTDYVGTFFVVASASPSNYIYYSTFTFYYFHLCSMSDELDLMVDSRELVALLFTVNFYFKCFFFVS